MFSPKRATAAAILALFSTPVLVLSQGGFFESCNKGWYFYGSDLVVQCPKEDGTFINSVEDMNFCMANDNGVLAAQNDGGFYGSCWGCDQYHFASQPDTPVVVCACFAADGSTQLPTLDLGTYLMALLSSQSVKAALAGLVICVVLGCGLE